MKVLFVIAHLNKGGGQAVQVLQLVRRLAPSVGSDMLALRAEGAPASFEHEPDVEVVGPLRFPRGVVALRRAIRSRRGQYDLVQAFDPYFSLPAARWAGARPLVVRMGAHPVDDFGSRYGRVGRFAMRALNPWLYARTTVVVNAEHLRSAFPGHDVVCIPNGVDCDRFPEVRNPAGARTRLGLPPEGPIALFTGKIIPRKNVDDLYWLARAVPGLRVVLVGNDREEHYGDAYHRQLRAQFADVADRVTAVGEVPMERVPLYLEAADLFVFPSRLEGMPNSVLEAWAAGLPVVAADTPAHREIWADGTGFLYTTRDELGADVQQLLADPARARALGAAGRAHVRERFSLDVAARRYLELYGRILSASAGGA